MHVCMTCEKCVFMCPNIAVVFDGWEDSNYQFKFYTRYLLPFFSFFLSCHGYFWLNNTANMGCI